MIVGGLRRRMIKDNLFYMIQSAMDDLDWFNPSSGLADQSVELLPEAISNLTEITPNKVVISAEELMTREWEMGSNLDEYRWDIYIDVFAEDESTGLHLSGDIYDIIKGKMASIGRTGPSLDVYDLREDDPQTLLFTCDLQGVEVGRVREWSREFNQFWWVIGFTVVDYYMGE